MQINIWELMEPLNAGESGQSKRMHKDVDTKGENTSFPGKDGREESRQAGSRQRRELGYSAKGNLVRADSWHKEKSKIKQGIMRVLHCKEGFHSFPGHCAMQSASPGHRNLPSLIPSLPPFPPSSLTHQVLPQPCRNSLPSLHWCKAAKKQQLVKENRF